MGRGEQIDEGSNLREKLRSDLEGERPGGRGAWALLPTGEFYGLLIKVWSWTSCMNTIWVLIKSADSQIHPGPAASEAAF